MIAAVIYLGLTWKIHGKAYRGHTIYYDLEAVSNYAKLHGHCDSQKDTINTDHKDKLASTLDFISLPGHFDEYAPSVNNLFANSNRFLSHQHICCINT